MQHAGGRSLRDGAGRPLHGRLPRASSRAWNRLWRTRSRIPAVVSVAEITGSESFVHVDAGEHRFVAQVPGVRRLEPGSAVTLYLDPRHLFVFDEAGRLRGRRTRQGGLRTTRMARITLDHLAHSYSARSARSRRTTP